MELSHYDPVLGNLQQQIADAHKKEHPAAGQIGDAPIRARSASEGPSFERSSRQPKVPAAPGAGTPGLAFFGPRALAPRLRLGFC
jgi:hypothetical protein